MLKIKCRYCFAFANFEKEKFLRSRQILEFSEAKCEMDDLLPCDIHICCDRKAIIVHLVYLINSMHQARVLLCHAGKLFPLKLYYSSTIVCLNLIWIELSTLKFQGVVASSLNSVEIYADVSKLVYKVGWGSFVEELDLTIFLHLNYICSVSQAKVTVINPDLLLRKE